MPNFNLYSPLPFKEAKLVEAIQVRAGNIAATHHITLAAQNLPPGMALGTDRRGRAGRSRRMCWWRPRRERPSITRVTPPKQMRPTKKKAPAAQSARTFPAPARESRARASPNGFAAIATSTSAGTCTTRRPARPETARPSIGIWWQTSRGLERRAWKPIRESNVGRQAAHCPSRRQAACGSTNSSRPSHPTTGAGRSPASRPSRTM